jgi:hypothetical protein
MRGLKLDRDRLTMVPAKRVAQSAMRIIDAVQRDPKESQIAGMACAFILLAKHLGVTQGDALGVAQRILNDKQRKTDLQAVALYITNELRNE